MSKSFQEKLREFEDGGFKTLIDFIRWYKQEYGGDVMAEMKNPTTISIDEVTKERLRKFKIIPAESWNSVINRMLDKLGGENEAK